ncbi:TPA: phage tail protein [Yersinia enterocolitica]
MGLPELKDASLTQKGMVQLSNATNSTNQILAATPKAVSDLGNLLLKITNNFSEIKDAGPAAVAQTLANLGLGDAAKKGIASNAEMQVGTADKLVSLIGLMSIFGKRDFTENDYIRIPDVPGGLIIQWCLVTNLLPNVAGVSAWSWTLPIPFPNRILGGAVTTGGTATPLSSGANLSGIPRTNGPIPNITGSVQNTRTDQSVSIYCIVIGR